YALPPLGQNPSTARDGTTPGSFANPPRIGTPYTFSSPDTPGMPPPSDKTAWDFRSISNFKPQVTQFEFAQAGMITPEMKFVSTGETHVSAKQIHNRVDLGRAIIAVNA